MTSEEKSEKWTMLANEKLLNSKAFCLFMVTENGNMDYVGNSELLNNAETMGLIFFIKSFNFPVKNKLNQ